MPQVALSFDVKKVSPDEQMLVYGWLSVAVTKDGRAVVDHHGDVIDIYTLEKAANDYMLDARGVGLEHERFRGIGRVVQSKVYTPEVVEQMGLAPGSVPLGWWFGLKIDDPKVWARVKSGELKMFSIGGSAKRVPVAAVNADVAKSDIAKSAEGAAKSVEAFQLVDLEIDEGSLVAAGANQHAHIVLFKREARPVTLFDKTRNAIKRMFAKDMIMPAAPSESEDTSTEMELPLTTQQILDENAWWQKWWQCRDAYEQSLQAILCADMTSDARQAALQQTTEEFISALTSDSMLKGMSLLGGVEHVDAALSAVLASKSSITDITKTLSLLEQDGNAPKREEKAMTVKSIEDIIKGLPAADAEIVRKAIPSTQAVVDPLAGLSEDVRKRVEAVEARNAELTKKIAEQERLAKRAEKLALVKAFMVPGLDSEQMAELLLKSDGTAEHDLHVASWKATTKAMTGLLKMPGRAAVSVDATLTPALAELERAKAEFISKGLDADAAEARALQIPGLLKRVRAEQRDAQ